MGESHFWKPFAQGVATPLVLIGGTNLLLKDFKVSNPYIYWGGLATSSAIVFGILADKIKVPILNAENLSREGTYNIDIESYIDNEDELEERGFSQRDIEAMKQDVENKYNDGDEVFEDLKTNELDIDIDGRLENEDDEVYLKYGDKMVGGVESGIDYVGDFGGFDAETFESNSNKIIVTDKYTHKKMALVGKTANGTPIWNKATSTGKIPKNARAYTTSLYGAGWYDRLLNGERHSRHEMPPKRTEHQLMEEIYHNYTQWEYGPENLWEDGEASLSRVKQKLALSKRKIKIAEKELGRKVSKTQAIEWAKKNTNFENYGAEHSILNYVDDGEGQMIITIQMTDDEATIDNAKEIIDILVDKSWENWEEHTEVGEGDKEITIYFEDMGGNTLRTFSYDVKGNKANDTIVDWFSDYDYPVGGYTADAETFNAESHFAADGKNCGCGQDPCKTYGAEKFNADVKMNDRAWVAYYEYDFMNVRPENPQNITGDSKMVSFRDYRKELYGIYLTTQEAKKAFNLLKGSLMGHGDWKEGHYRQVINGYKQIYGGTPQRKTIPMQMKFEYVPIRRFGYDTAMHTKSKNAETFNSDSHTDSFMADMPVNAIKNGDGWYIPSINRNDYKEIFKNWSPNAYPYEKKITQDSVNEACNSCGEEKVHYQFYLAQKNSVNPKMRFVDGATYCHYDTNTCGGNICGDCAENATCENCGAEICTFCEEENNYEHSDLVCLDCREFEESLEDD